MNLDEQTKYTCIKEVCEGTCRIHVTKGDGFTLLKAAAPDDLSAEECNYEVSICESRFGLDLWLKITDEQGQVLTDKKIDKPEKAGQLHRTARAVYGWMIAKSVYVTKGRAETISNSYDFEQAKRNRRLTAEFEAKAERTKLEATAKAAKLKIEQSHGEVMALHDELRSLRIRLTQALVRGLDATDLEKQVADTIAKLNKRLEVYNKAAMPEVVVDDEDETDEE